MTPPPITMRESGTREATSWSTRCGQAEGEHRVRWTARTTAEPLVQPAQARRPTVQEWGLRVRSRAGLKWSECSPSELGILSSERAPVDEMITFSSYSTPGSAMTCDASRLPVLSCQAKHINRCELQDTMSYLPLPAGLPACRPSAC